MCASSTCTSALRSATSTRRLRGRARARSASLARQERARFLLQQLARLAGAHRAAALHFALLELEQVRHRIGHVGASMRGEHPGHRERGGAIEPAQKTRVIARIEAVGDFIEQQQLRPAGERPRDEHQAALAVRQREKAALGERVDVRVASSSAPTRPVPRASSSRIGISVRCTPVPTTLARAEVPVVVFVAVLALGTDVGDLVGDAGGRVEGFALPAVTAQLAACGFGPHAARDQFEQLGLAGAVAADQQPALPGLNAPVHVAQHRALAAIEIDAPERDGK